ncbi:dipeptidase ASCRUDRAFT_74128, partial [Ascoidea rubescens DSM 1968]
MTLDCVGDVEDYSKELELIEKLSKKNPIVDTHNDFPYLVRTQLRYEIENDNCFKFDGKLTSNTSILKLIKGKIGIQFFSCFIECKDDDYLYQDFNKPNSAVRDTLEQIDIIKRLVDKYPKYLNLVYNSKDALNQFQMTNKISITMGVEGLHQVDLSLGVLRTYFDLGVRYITLTHNCDNPFATAASSVTGGLEDKGLSAYGVNCIKEMNRLGLMVDLSHVSYKTMLDVLKETRCPVIFSHSSVYKLTPNERNVRDDVLMKLKENSGVCCVNFFPLFISQNKDRTATIDDAVDHIIYIINLIGWKYVGFGS